MTIEDPRTRNPFDREALARRALEPRRSPARSPR